MTDTNNGPAGTTPLPTEGHGEPGAANTPARPVVPMLTLENVNLEALERAIYARDYENASKMLLQTLQRLKVGASFIGLPVAADALRHSYTRVAAAIIAMMADPAMQMSLQGFEMLATEHATVDTLFRSSHLRNSDHLLMLLAANPDEDRAKWRAEGPQMVKFILTQSLASNMNLDHRAAFGQQPQTFFGLWCGMLAPLLVLTEKASERREMLLGLHDVFADCVAGQTMLPCISDAYMYASYALRPDKHLMKRTIIDSMRRGLLQAYVEELTPEQVQQRRARRLQPGYRPTILVAVEWFGGQHAMYRCYAPIIRQLRQRYRLVAMSRAVDIDELGKAEFDEWHEVSSSGLVLGELVRRIIDMAPDMIYHPSLGMAMWWVALASLRLAPIQFMTLGHPSSSMSSTMDYLLCDDGAYGDPALAVERIVTYPNGSARYAPRTDVPVPDPVREASGDAVNIAVPAMLCKVSVPFLRVCRAIDEAAKAMGKVVRWHFFINMMGMNLLQAAREIREWLPDAMTYERSGYEGYMGHLRGCDINACTFPFGGTNSNIDAMLLGIMPVCMEGQEPHERFDAHMIRRAQLPDWLIAHSEAEYIAAMLRLIDDDAERRRIREHLLTFDLQGEFYGEPPDNRAFARAVDLIYDQHEELQKTPRGLPVDSVPVFQPFCQVVENPFVTAMQAVGADVMGAP
jgi:hypothetical protein